MKMKKFLALLLAGTMVFSVAACGSEEQETSKPSETKKEEQTVASESSSVVEEEPEEIVTLKIYLLGNPVATSDFAPVLDAMNEITREEIGAELDITFLDGGSMQEKMNVIMASGEVYDICWTGYANLYAKAVENGGLYDMTDLVAASDIVQESVIDIAMERTIIDGRCYGVPCMQTMSAPYGVHMRKDLVEKYDFDYESCTSLADFAPLFDAIAENEPGKVAFYTDDSDMMWSYREIYAPLNIGGLAIKKDGSNEIYSLYDLPEYRADAELMHEFYEKGYIKEDALTYERGNKDADIKAGVFATWAKATKPGVEVENMNSLGIETVTKRIAVPEMSNPLNTVLSISATSENPEKAFEWIELMHSNTELMDLICYGVEGIHYSLNDAGKIVLDPNAKYNQSGFSWAFGNQFVLTLLENQQDDLWEQTKELNANAQSSYIHGFSVPTEIKESYATESALISAVTKEYNLILKNGIQDPDEYWEELQSRIADSQKVIKEKIQPIVDEWLASKK